MQEEGHGYDLCRTEETLVMTCAGVLAGFCVSEGGSQVQLDDNRHLRVRQMGEIHLKGMPRS
jgi:hypothetical protein